MYKVSVKATLRECLIFVIGLMLLFLSPVPSANGAAVQLTQEAQDNSVQQIVMNKERADKRQQVSMEVENEPLISALRRLAKEVQVGFSFQEYVIPDKKVTIRFEEVPVYEALDFLLEGTGLEVALSPEQDILIIREKFDQKLRIQLQNVSGAVTDAQSGETLPGVNVMIKGTTTGTSTGSDGSYELNAPSLQDTLIFSFVGYQTQEVPIEGRTEIDVALQSQAIAGEELVVVGYGTQRRSDLTGSIGSVSGEDIEDALSNTLTESIQGRIAGVNIKSASNAPGGGMRIRIRGTNSINASSEPLYVIDGVPINNMNLQPAGAGNNALPQDPLSSISPDNIESIEVLKDASATAIYGARGANGVVLVTTKRGEVGEAKVGFSYSTNIATVRKKLELATAEELAILHNEWDENNGQSPTYDGIEKPSPEGLGDGTDWQDQIFRTALTHTANLSVSGGNEKTMYSLSGSYWDEDGIIIESNFKRAGLKFNLDQKINERIQLGLNVSANRSINNAVPSDGTGYQNDTPLFNALMTTPVIPVRDDEGNYIHNHDETYKILENPVSIAETRTDLTHVNRFISSFFVDFELYNGLVFKANFGADIINSKRNVYIPNTAETQALPNEGIASIGTINSYNWLGEYTLRYEKLIREDHQLNLVAGYTFEPSTTERTFSSAEEFFTNNLEYNDLSAGSNPRPPASGTIEAGLVSYLGRANYIYKDKYLFTGSFRRDGSSKFGSDNKWGGFPSAAFSWRVSEERFLNNIDWISNLKFRTSYGLTGNEGIGSYQSLQIYNTVNPIIGGEPVIGLVPNRISNPDLSWEKTTQFDVGIDVELFAGKLNFTSDYYVKKTDDLLLNIPIPNQSGYGSAIQNIGSVENRGVEFSLGLQNSFGEVQWSSSFNITFNRNKILALSENSERIILGLGRGEAAHGRSIVIPGEPLGTFWGYRFGGIWQSEEEIEEAGRIVGGVNRPGLPKYEDLDGSGSFTEDNNDREIVGDPNPDFIFGWSSDFNYKNIGLSIFINGSYGNDIANLNDIILLSQPQKHNVLKRYFDERWAGEGSGNVIETPLHHAGEWKMFSDRNVEDGSFLRLKTIRLSYNIPTSIFDVRNSQIYLAANNLFTITNYSGFDPEVDLYQDSNAQLGVDNGAYPASKDIRLGIKLDF